MADDWLADIVVLNESGELAVAGDVSVFRSAAGACSDLEHWWVEDGEGFAFTASGDRLTLGVDPKRRVIVVSQEAAPGGAELVRAWLRAHARAVLGARRSKATRGKVALSKSEEQGLLPTSIEGLIAYVGFDG